MTKMARMFPTARPAAGPTATTLPTRTHEGGAGFELDARSALFTLAVTNMVGEDTFYETASKRDSLFAHLVRVVAQEDPSWVAQFIPWLRQEANMRTVSLIAACEYVRAGGPHGRAVVAGACQRADEPGDLLTYWVGVYGRRIPQPVKRGVADAVTRLYNPRSYIKYDSGKARMRFGDVIELTHPTPRNSDQSALFRRAIDDRQGRANPTPVAAVDQYRAWVQAGAPLHSIPDVATWENLSAHHQMDAKAWEAIIPQMGYMALLRNLRNFEQAGVSKYVLAPIAGHLCNPDEVAKSRQLPFRFLTAWVESGSMLFGPALEDALALSVSNIPALPGKTLVAVDVSGSMDATLSARSKVSRKMAAGLFGAAVYDRSARGSALMVYATDGAIATPQRSVLRTAEEISKLQGVNGHGTNTWPAISAAWRAAGPFDRVLIFTDMQDHPSNGDAFIPRGVPVYVWDLAGYGRANVDLTPGSGRYVMGGLSDRTFQLIPLLERGLDAGWPWDDDPPSYYSRPESVDPILG